MSLNLAPPMIDSLEIVLDLLSRPATSPAEKLFSDSFIKWLKDGDERPLQSALRLRGTPPRSRFFVLACLCSGNTGSTLPRPRNRRPPGFEPPNPEKKKPALGPAFCLLCAYFSFSLTGATPLSA